MCVTRPKPENKYDKMYATLARGAGRFVNITLFLSVLPCIKKQEMVPPARLERALPKKRDFESRASTNSATGALHIAGCQCIRGDLCSAKEF